MGHAWAAGIRLHCRNAVLKNSSLKIRQPVPRPLHCHALLACLNKPLGECGVNGQRLGMVRAEHALRLRQHLRPRLRHSH